MEEKKTLFLIDAYALIFRAYYAFISRPIKNSKGLNTSAVFGFVNSLDEILRKENPSHIAVAFDPPAPTFRNELFTEYKANRLVTPEEIKLSVPYIKEILKAYNIPVLEIEGYEADDVIGTLARTAEKEGFKTYMVTPDKDFCQLVSEQILLYKPGRSGGDVEIMGEKEIKKKYMIDEPAQIIDILALWGDSSDNVPGVTGVGEKTSKKLIAEYKSIENLVRNSEKLKGKLRQNIESSVEKMKLSKKLVTIITNVPVNFRIDEFKRMEMDKKRMMELFNELEFKSLQSRIITNNVKNSEYHEAVQGDLFSSVNKQPGSAPDNLKTIDTEKHEYILVDTKEKRTALIRNLNKQKEFCFDTETTSLNVYEAELVGLAFSYENARAWYVTFPEDQEESLAIINEFKELFKNQEIKKLGQNLKFDILVLKNYNIVVEGDLFDTMIAHYLIQPELRHNLNYLAETYLRYKMVSIESIIGSKGKNQKSMRVVDQEKQKEYAGEDADITWQLSKILTRTLKDNNLEELSAKVEMPLISVLADMEATGIKISIKDLNDYAKVLIDEINNVKEEIYELSGMEFNISSPKQLGEVLFEKLKISDNIKMTRTKQYSTGEEVLVRLKDSHPVVEKVLDYRSLTKLLSTYVEALPKLINPKTGRIHTSYNQSIAATGRLSSTNPNLQNIPIREERGKEIRKSFVPSSSDNVLLAADYSQIELRLMAHMSGDSNLIDAFVKGQDIHTSTAARIFGISPEEVSKEQRRKAKTANFGIIYGISAFGLSQRLNIPRKEAGELIDNYFKTYSNVKTYMTNVIGQSKKTGYVKTIMGRKRYLPDINSANALVRGMAERNAINAPIQGSAADIIKLAMINIHSQLNKKNYLSKMILQVHDELIFDVNKNELDDIKKLVKFEMENAVKLKVPLIVEMGTGNDWLEAH